MTAHQDSRRPGHEKGSSPAVIVTEHREPYGNFSIDLPQFAAQFKARASATPFKVRADHRRGLESVDQYRERDPRHQKQRAADGAPKLPLPEAPLSPARLFWYSLHRDALGFRPFAITGYPHRIIVKIVALQECRKLTD